MAAAIISATLDTKLLVKLDMRVCVWFRLYDICHTNNRHVMFERVRERDEIYKILHN